MKKFFTFLTMLCFLGFLGAQANPGDVITFKFTTNDPAHENDPSIYEKVIIQPYVDGPTITYQDPIQLTSNTWELTIEGQPLTFRLMPVDSDYTIFIKEQPSELSGTLRENNVFGQGAYQLIVNPNSSACEVPVVVGYPEAKDPVNPIYFDFTLPENSDNPFIVSSISFLDKITEVANYEELQAAWISFYNEEREDGSQPPMVTNATLTINFATDVEGAPIYSIGGVTMSYTTTSNPTPVDFPTERINFSNTAASIAFDYIEGMDKIYVVVKDAESGWDITFNVNDPDGVVVTYNNDTVELDGDSTIITVDVDGSFTFRAADGWEITEATYGNGKAISYTGEGVEKVYNADELADGTVVNVTVSEVIPEDQYEDSFTVWFEEGEDGEVLFASASYQAGESGAVKDFTELAGAQTVMFDAASANVFMIKATPVNTTDYPNIYAYYCGVYRGETPAQFTSTVYSGVPVNGADLALYVNEPDTYTVTFAGENGATETETTVWTNEVNRLSGWANATEPWEMLAGTVVTLYVPETYEVTLNDEAIYPVEEEENAQDGIAVYEVEINENANIVFIGDEEPETDGVAGIDAENGPAVIYNLQGIRVNSENVPAGVYIINGKKVAVRK